MTWALDSVPSANVTLISVALETTCKLVRMSALSSIITPLPMPLSPLPFISGNFVWISTNEGWMAWYTWAEKAGGGVAEAIAWVIESLTSRVVKGGGAGKKKL